VPNITRIVGMHNYTPDANADKVWAGVVLRHDDGQYQFVALYGPRLGPLREANQQRTSSFRANQKFDQMLRDKRAHGYDIVDWTSPRYSLSRAIQRLGNIAGSQSVMPGGTREVAPADPRTAVVREVPRETQRPPVDHPIEQAVTPAPSVEQLTEYLASRTNRGKGPVPAPEPEKPKTPEAQPPIRRARRLDF